MNRYRRISPSLTHVHAGALLDRDHLIDGAVLHALELRRGQSARLEGGAGLLEIGRAKDRSDDLGTKHGGSSPLRPRGS
jgi:hypothetical protein